jgi:hypothetical protein
MGIFWLQQARTDSEFPMCSMCALDAQTARPWIAQGEAAKMNITLLGKALAEWKCDLPEDLFYAWAVSRWPK